MSTTVTYKGSTLTTVENETRTLTTSGKYLEDNITLVDETAPFEPELQTKSETYTPTTSQQTESITADVGYDALERVNITVNAVATAEYSVDIGNNDEFYNDGANRKYRLRPYLFVDEAGWVSSDTAGVWKNYSAVPSGTTITPTESAQTVGGTKHMMEGAVTVNAISSNYVGTGITRRSSTDLTASGATVTAPAGYYASSASKSVASMTLPSATSNSEVGTKKADIFPSTADTTYLNIPVGYNSTAQHYKIRALMIDYKSITANGTYSAASDDLDGFSSVIVNVPTVTITQSGSNLSIV